MKILILGATGQVGQALTTGLSRTEHQVCVLGFVCGIEERLCAR